MLRKHSVSIRGHRTSYSLEDEFYAELTRLAAQKNMPLARVIAEIDSRRKPGVNLSSCLRLHVLRHLQDRSGVF